MNEKTLERIKSLTEMHGAPNFETPVRHYLEHEMRPYVETFVRDKMGGIYGVKKSQQSNAPKVMVAAHMDEIGFMITEVTKQGFIKFTPLGGVASDIWQGQRLKIKTGEGDEITGVVANIPKHFQTGKESTPKIEDLLLDIGAEDASEVYARGIAIGDSIVPNTELLQLSQYRYAAKAWDNRYGCVLAIEILEALHDVQLDFDLYVGANVQEEVGLRGAEAATQLIQPDVAFVVDCSPANDMKGKSGLSGELGAGALLRIKDGTMLLKPAFKSYLLDVANKHSVSYQHYISPGGTDGGVIHKALTGVPTAVIGVCARYIHSTDAVFDIRDYENAKNWLYYAIQQLDDKVIHQLQYED
ncbi:M42 family metallopeptidase [Staphylococcus sp. 11007852]|uniref:M42 family metallopeptidase n=1 Tax=Staphylococcus TaxID=1279 RepID=UPI0014034AF2|nr:MULTISPECIES: M42 family metallopeptidase [Staphylococcus]NHM75480.1 M42 family metallopeptidase [Staphylococcus sp. 11007852]NJH83362.1 M20/M25/M40 family metallo-hydrolase [Staphylococcus agnetis]